MSGHLLLCCLFLLADLSLSETSSYRDLINYTSQVNILHDMLEAEGCVHPIVKNLRTREILGTSERHNHEIEVQVQKSLYHQLKAVLVECRSTESKKKTNPTTQPQTASTTITPAPTTVTTTTIPPTTKTNISTTTRKTTATTTPTTTITTSRPTTTPALTECQSALNLTEGWRQDHKGSDIRPKNGNSNCDTREMIESGRPWFRFSGDAGNHLMDKCVPYNSCGTTVGLWSDDTMPTQVGVITQVNVYGRGGDNCRYHTRTQKISVVRCSTSPHDYIYRYDGDSDVCDLGFCGMAA